MGKKIIVLVSFLDCEQTVEHLNMSLIFKHRAYTFVFRRLVSEDGHNVTRDSLNGLRQQIAAATKSAAHSEKSYKINCLARHWQSISPLCQSLHPSFPPNDSERFSSSTGRRDGGQ